MQTDPGNSTAGAPGRCDLGPMPTRKVGARGPCHEAPEWKPSRGIQRRVRRSGATLDRRRHQKLGRASSATELLNRNRPGKFNGGLAGPVLSWDAMTAPKVGGMRAGLGRVQRRLQAI